jgi:hypothetical protein
LEELQRQVIFFCGPRPLRSISLPTYNISSAVDFKYISNNLMKSLLLNIIRPDDCDNIMRNSIIGSRFVTGFIMIRSFLYDITLTIRHIIGDYELFQTILIDRTHHSL